MHLVGRLVPFANLVSTNVVRSVRRRGNVNNGANDGLRYFNANNAPSNAHWTYGAGLYPRPVQAWPLMRSPVLGIHLLS